VRRSCTSIAKICPDIPEVAEQVGRPIAPRARRHQAGDTGRQM
jgi:hypothetical protein